MKILIIQKSVVLCQRLITLLETSRRYEAIGFVGGMDSALKLICCDKPDALLLDLHLAEGGAIRLLEELHNSGRALPIVILAETRGEEYLRRAEELGAAAFLDKDSEFQAIVPTLDRLLLSSADTARLAANCATPRI